MKKMMNAFLVLCVGVGFDAMAAEPTSSPAATTGPGMEETTAKEKKPPSTKSRARFKNNLFYGGYINLSLGSYKVIGIEPMVGYRLTPKFSTGVKVRYNYIKDERYAKSYSTSTYGGSVFARYSVTPQFYAQVEPATYNYEYFYLGGGSEREWVPFLLMGGGFTQPLGERTWLNVEILFDVLQDNQSPYDDWTPFFSIGVGAGF